VGHYFERSEDETKFRVAHEDSECRVHYLTDWLTRDEAAAVSANSVLSAARLQALQAAIQFPHQAPVGGLRIAVDEARAREASACVMHILGAAKTQEDVEAATWKALGNCLGPVVLPPAVVELLDAVAPAIRAALDGERVSLRDVTRLRAAWEAAKPYRRDA